MKNIVKNRFFKVFIIFILSFNISFLTFTSVKQDTANASITVAIGGATVGAGLALITCAMILGVTFTSSEEIAVFTSGVMDSIFQATFDYESSIHELQGKTKEEVVSLVVKGAKYTKDLYNIIKNYIASMGYTMPYPQTSFVQGPNTIHYSLSPNYFDFEQKYPTETNIIASFPVGDYSLYINDTHINKLSFVNSELLLWVEFDGYGAFVRYATRDINTGQLSVLPTRDYPFYSVPKAITGELTLNILTYPPDVLDDSVNGVAQPDVDVSSLKDSKVGSLDEALDGKVKEGFGVLVPPVVGGLSADLPWTRENIGVLFPDISKDKALSWEDSAVKDVIIENVDGEVISIPNAAEGDVTFPFISGLRSLLLSLFVPGDDYFISFFNEMKENFESKLSISDFTAIFDSDYSSKRLDNITFPYKGREYVILSFDFFYDNRDAFDKWSRAFFFVLLAIFNYNQIYRIFRSSSYVTSSTFTTSDKK